MRRTHKVEFANKNEEITNKYDLLVFGKDEEKLDYNLAPCCNPIPGDNVFGFVTVSEGIKIHKQNCPNALSMQSQFAYRIMQAKWIDSSQQEHNVLLKLTGFDNVGIVNEVTRIISSTMNVNINNLNISTDNGMFDGKIVVGIKNNDQLKKLMERLKKIEGIDKVVRLNN